jgi:hypothetical protein
VVFAIFAGCTPFDTKMPIEYTQRPKPMISIGPAIQLDPDQLRVLARPQIDTNSSVHILAVKNSSPNLHILGSLLEAMFIKRSVDQPVKYDSGPIEIIHLVANRQAVIMREVISRTGFGTDSVRDAQSAFDYSGRLHLLIEYETPSKEPAFLHLIRNPDGWTESSKAACAWLLSSSGGLICAFRSDSKRISHKDWVTPQFVAQSTMNYGKDLVLAFEINGELAPRIVARDRECPHFRAESFTIDNDGSAHVTYLCGETSADKTTWRRRYARFSLDEGSANIDIRTTAQPSFISDKIRQVNLVGTPLEIAPVDIAPNSESQITLLVGQCKSQEVKLGTATLPEHYCSVLNTEEGVYRLRDNARVLRRSGKFRGFGLLASVRSPDGRDGEIHYLQYLDGGWSSPVTVTRESTFAVGGCDCVAHTDGHAFLITRESGTVGRWIDFGK